MALVTAGLNRLFQSTLSVRRATDLLVSLGPIPYISIHALRKESDWYANRISRCSPAFQSTLSVRRATAANLTGNRPSVFQSTLSVRRATQQ